MDDTMLFECDCHGRDHIIQAFRDDEEVYLMFKVQVGDCDTDKWISSKYDNFLQRTWLRCGNFFRRKWWRIKTATIILFKGYMDMEDSWLPVRREGESIFGIKETRKLCEYLLNAVDEIEATHNSKTVKSE